MTDTPRLANNIMRHLDRLFTARLGIDLRAEVISECIAVICFELDAASLDGRRPQDRAEPQGWQPIETAPKDGTPFIAANQMDAFRAFYDLEGEVWTCEDDGKWFGQLRYPPTHWMSLPVPPKDRL